MPAEKANDDAEVLPGDDEDDWDEDDGDEREPGRVESTTRKGLLLVAVLILGVVVGRLTAPDDSSEGEEGEAAPREIQFPSGDVNRTNYWGFFFEPRVIDTFDRENDREDLGTSGTGQVWEVLSGTWGIRDNSAANFGASGNRPSLAVIPRGTGDGIFEVLMTTVENGAGLVFRYLDEENYWSVTANPGVGSWSVTRVIDGEDELVGELRGPTTDGTTLTVIQTGEALRFLLEGEDYLTLNDAALSEQRQGGLIAAPTSTGRARWDRFYIGETIPPANN